MIQPINSHLKLGRMLAASLFLVTNAFAGYVYELSQTDAEDGTSSKSESGSTKFMVDGSKIKMSGFGDGGSEMIYNGDRQEMLIVNHDRKSYFQLDKKSVEEMAAKVNDAMAQMEAQLAKMPPAQRQMMENMMKDKMPAAVSEKPELTVSRTGKTDTVAGYEAERIDVMSPDGKQRELWVASWSDLKGSKQIAEAFKGMSQLFSGMMNAFSEGPLGRFAQVQTQNDWMEQMHQLNGFPVMTREFDKAGKLISETALSNVEETDIADSEFAPPKGYKRQKMGM